MDKMINIFIDGAKIGSINHGNLFDDEKNSGREICKGCKFTLNDFSYRVIEIVDNKEYYDVSVIVID